MNLKRNNKLNKLKNKSIYKYLPSKFREEFINKGDILFRNLTYFNNYEDNNKRGDVFDGGIYHNPINGFEVKNITQSKEVKLKNSFSYIDTDDIFVCCFSKRLDLVLFKEFDTDCCIEILNPIEFTKRIGKTLKVTHFDYDEITYYNTIENHHHIINKPETIPFFKTLNFEPQQEYRYLFSDNKIKSEIKFSTVSLINEQILEPKGIGKEIKLEIGSLKDIVKIHYLNEFQK